MQNAHLYYVHLTVLLFIITVTNYPLGVCPVNRIECFPDDAIWEAHYSKMMAAIHQNKIPSKEF